MGLFDGGLFDFNGDGQTSFGEGFLGFMLFNELIAGMKQSATRTTKTMMKMRFD